MRKRLSRAAVVATVVALTAVACSNSTTTTSAGSSGGGTAPAFDLTIGDIVSLTGDLSAYGPAIDKGAHVAVQVINDALAHVYRLHYGKSTKALAEVVPDNDYAGMWRIRWPNASSQSLRRRHCPDESQEG